MLVTLADLGAPRFATIGVYALNGRLLRLTANERQSFRRTQDGNRVEILVDERG